MQVDINSGPAYAFADITLPPGGRVRVKSAALAMTLGDVQIAAPTEKGFFEDLLREFAGENSEFNDFASTTGGTIGVAPTLPGDIALVPLDGALLVQSGSWIAADPGIEVDPDWRADNSFFSSEDLRLLRCLGQGDVLLSAYGAIRGYTLAADDQTLTLDTGHVLAFDESVKYSVRSPSGWSSTFLGGETQVTDFRGPGRVWFQTRSSAVLADWIKGHLPTPPPVQFGTETPEQE